jgi:hypothetical protein
MEARRIHARPDMILKSPVSPSATTALKVVHPSAEPTKTEVYIHIPKTAGTFIRNILVNKYGDVGYSYGTPPYTSLSRKSDREIRAFKTRSLVIGHEDFYTFYALFGDSARYSTLVRNPIDRLISYYNHVMNNFEGFKDRPVSLLRFLEGQKNFELDNLQVRYLCGKPRDQPVTRRDLDAAKSLIKNGTIEIGLADALPEAVRSMRVFSGLGTVSSTRKVNVSKRGFSRDTIADVELAAIKARSKLDLALFRFCRKEIINKRRKENGKSHEA